MSSWRFCEIYANFSNDRKHLGLPFHKFIERIRNVSKQSVTEMENLLREDKKEEITSKAFNEYMVEISELIKRKMNHNRELIEKGNKTCILAQVKKASDKNEEEAEVSLKKFHTQTYIEFEDRLEIYLEKINRISEIISLKYEECSKSANIFEKCLNNYIKVCNIVLFQLKQN